MGLIVLIIVIILLCLLLLGSYFLFLSLFIVDARYKFHSIEEEIRKINLPGLVWKLDLLKKHKKELDHQIYKDLDEEINFLTTQYNLKISKKGAFLINELKKWYFFNPYTFHQKLNKYRIIVFEQYLFYLNLEFSINEYLLEQEINSQIINLIKNYFGKTTSQLYKSEFIEITTGSFLLKKIHFIENKIKILQENLHFSSLSNEVKNLINEIIKKSNELQYDLNFLESAFLFWNKTFNKEIDNLILNISNNPIALKNTKKTIIKEINSLKEIKRNSIVEALQIYIVNVTKTINDTAHKIKELKLDINLNISAYNLIANFDDKISKVILNFWDDKKIIIQYINYFELKNAKTQISKLTQFSISLTNAEYNYQHLTTDFTTINSKITSYHLFKNLLKLMNIFDANIQEMLKNQKVINVIIKSTDIVNELVAEINTTLLNAEYDLNTLPVEVRRNYAMQLDDYQNKLEQLMSYFRKSVKFVDNDKIVLVKEILTNTIKLQQKIKRAAFLRFYNESLIIELNKFNNNSLTYNSFIEFIEKAYHAGEQTEVLRLSKKLVESLNIHE